MALLGSTSTTMLGRVRGEVALDVADALHPGQVGHDGVAGLLRCQPGHRRSRRWPGRRRHRTPCCSSTATVKPSAVATGARAASSSSVLRVEVDAVVQADRDAGAVAARPRERRLERLDAGVRVARDGALDELDLGVGGGSRCPPPARSARARRPSSRPGRGDGHGEDGLAARVDERGGQQGHQRQRDDEQARARCPRSPSA